jgi:hypothetical protein
MAEFPYGYDAAGANYGYAELAGTDANDLFMPAGSTSRQSMGFLVDLSFAPVTFSASVGGLFEKWSRPSKTPWELPGNTVSSNYDSAYDPTITSGMNFALRAEGAKILDMITAAAIYKYAGSSLEKLAAASSDDTIEEKIRNHAFGLYVNITPPIPGLGISVGYSGQLKTLKNPRYKDTDIKSGVLEGNPDWEGLYLANEHRETKFPYYSGIDLRVVYTGIENLTMTSSNNISFARIYGTKDRDEIFVYGWAYEGKLNDSTTGVNKVPLRSENYLGLYNALGASYRITESLTADLQLANQFAMFTLNWEEAPLESVTNSFGVYAGVTCKVYEKDNFHASIRGGLDLKWNSYSYQEDSVSASVHKAGYMDLGIPVAVKVVF